MKCKAKKMSEYDEANIEKAADFMRSKHKPSYSQAYEFMLLRYYCKDFKMIDGVRIPVLLPPEERPTFNQVLYRIRKVLRARSIAREIVKLEVVGTQNVRWRCLIFEKLKI